MLHCRLIQAHQDYRNKLSNSPEAHPEYSTEWTSYWEQKYLELVKSNRDTSTYDFVPEWKKYWSKRVEILLGIELESQV